MENKKTNIFSRIFKPQSKITIEEKTYKDGHLYIRRETKTGEVAEKEIEKHSKSMSDWIRNFLEALDE